MLFRFGFICAPRGAKLQLSGEIEQTWRRQTLGAFAILVHPETAIERAGTSGLQCLLIGDLLGPSLADRLQSLSSNPTPDENGLLGILDGMCGRFALLWDDGRGVRILADAVGSRTIYYTNTPFGIAASHAGLVSRAVRARPCDRVARLIDAPEYRSLQVGYLPGDVTPHAGIHALPPNHHFCFQSGRVTRFWPRLPCRPSETADFVKICTAYLEQFHDDLVAKRKNRALRSHRRDRQPDAHLGLARSRNTFREPYLDRAESRSGRATHYRRTRATALSTSCQCRPRHLLPRAGRQDRPGQHRRASRALTEELFEQCAARIGLESTPPCGYDPSDLFFWEHRLATMGAGMLNEMDVAVPSLVGFNDRRLFDIAFGLPARDRFSKDLMLRVIQGLAPDLASIPVHRMRRWTLGSRVGRWRKIATRAIRHRNSR